MAYPCVDPNAPTTSIKFDSALDRTAIVPSVTG